MKTTLRWLCLGLCFVLFEACGYVISSRPDGFSGPPQTLSLGVIENRLLPPRPGLELELTRRLRAEIATDARFEFAREGADLNVEVALVEFSEPTIVRNEQDRASEIGLRAGVEIRIRDRRVPGPVIVRKTAANGEYAPGGNETRQSGLDRLWRDLARAILDAIADRDWLKDTN